MIRKKSGITKKWVAVIILAAAVLMLGGCNSQQETAQTELKEGQRKAQLQVVSITGNELTYIELETETEAESETETGSEKETETGSEGQSLEVGVLQEETAGETTSGQKLDRTGFDRGSGEMPDMSQMSDGEMPDMSQMSDGEMPDMSQMPDGEMPDMSQMPDMGQTDGSGTAESGQTDESGTSSNAMNRRGMNVSTTTVYLPVGVKVYTSGGTETTFSLLEAGDQLEVIFETDENENEVITEIRII